jgi:hypothetical protein
MVQVFQPIGRRVSDGALLLYTAPARLTGNPTEAQFADYLSHLRRIQEPWIWIVDCRGMTAQHLANMSMAQRLQSILREEHGHLLKDTWILFLNSWLRTLLALFQAPVVSLSPDRLELLVYLQQQRIERGAQDWLLAVAAT